jgi:hypothetical protein
LNPLAGAARKAKPNGSNGEAVKTRQEYPSRLVPTPFYGKALRGTWSLDGKVVRLDQDPESGILLALNEDGELVNPLMVIARGQRLGMSEPGEAASEY